MRINLLKIIFLALVIVSAGCSPKENKDTKASAKSNSLNTYGGKWRYVHDGSELYIGNKNIDKIYFLPTYEKSAPEQFEGYGHYVFSPVDENLLVQKRKNNTDIYLVRDGIKNTVVKGQIASPQASSINIPLAFSSSGLSDIGGIEAVLKNINTEDIIKIKTSNDGAIKSDTIPTGKYAISVSNNNNSFKDEFEISGQDADFGILNIAAKDSLNFKISASVSKEIFSKSNSTSQYSRLTSNDITYDFYRGQYIFPLGDLQQISPNKDAEFQDPTWVTLNIKNISETHAGGVTFEIHCEKLDWIMGCGRSNANHLVYDAGTLSPNQDRSYSIWLQARPFNSERKDITIPVSIYTADSMEWKDTVTITAYKKPQTVKVSMPKSNTGYVFLPGRNSIKLYSNNAYINLPFINNHAFQLLYSNNSEYSQTNYSITNSSQNNPTSMDDLKLDKGWSRNYEPANDMESTAPLIQQGDVIDAYLHKGDLDYYKITVNDGITITATDEKSQSVLNDKTVSAHTPLKFKATILDAKETTALHWQQVRGPKVDLEISTDGSTASLITPSFSKKETLVFRVYYIAESGHEVFDYLSATVNPFTTATVQTAENTDKDLHTSANTSNLILNYSNVKDANNTFTINEHTNLNTLTISEGVTLIIEEGSTLTVNNHLFAAGSTIEVKGTLDLKTLAAPSIPTGSTVVLDGTLDVTDGLVVRGTLTHSQGIENGEANSLKLKISGKLTIAKEGKIDASAKGLNAVAGYCIYYNQLNEIEYPSCSSYSSYGGTHATHGTNSNNIALSHNTYGSVATPTSLGGSSNHAHGGGAISLEAFTIENNGQILVDGESFHDHVGAGGSVLIQVKDKVSGSGAISTKGGSAKSNSYNTKGGLGRIAIKGYKEITLSLDNIKDYGSLWLQPDGATGGDIYLPVDTTWNIYEDTIVNKIVSDAEIQIDVSAGSNLTFTSPQTESELPKGVQIARH